MYNILQSKKNKILYFQQVAKKLKQTEIFINFRAYALFDHFKERATITDTIVDVKLNKWR